MSRSEGLYQISGIAIRDFGGDVSREEKKTRLLLLGSQFRIKNEWRGVFKCNCGNVVVRRIRDVGLNKTKSCGCLHAESVKKNRRTHGATSGRNTTHLYRTWTGMTKRCRDPSAANYKYYGGKGIKVCDEWLDSFVSFRDWATSHGYEEGLSIERIDNNKGYYPDNCKWIPLNQQNSNTSRNRWVTYGGETLTVSQLARKYGLKPRRLHRRLYDFNWPIEKALFYSHPRRTQC